MKMVILLKIILFQKMVLIDFVELIDENREKLLDSVIHMDTEKNGVPVEIAMHYNTSFSENIHSYVNNINTHEGGNTPFRFRRALTRTLKRYADEIWYVR